MARPLRIEFPGAVYHITARGNEKKKIFRSERGNERFLEILSLVVDRFGWVCHAYCLMGNHYHLLVETPRGNLSKGMKQLNGIYTQKFNRNYNRVGHLFQGRYRAILVEKESYLLELCRYIILNPVRAGFVEHPQAWQWSSYRATVGMIEKPGFLTIDWTLSQFGEDRGNAITEYIQYVLSGLYIAFPASEVVGQIIIGSEGFINKVNINLNEKPITNFEEVPKEQQFALKPDLEEIFQREMMTGLPRDAVIHKIYYEHNFTMKEIGDFLSIHYTWVSRIIKQYEKEQKSLERKN